jgi:hypothetical protein
MVALGVLVALDDSLFGNLFEARSVSMPLRYLIGLPLGLWIMRKAMVPSVEVAGKQPYGDENEGRRRLPDQTGMGAMRDTRERYRLPESGAGDAHGK